jgi:hypothetical protein
VKSQLRARSRVFEAPQDKPDIAWLGAGSALSQATSYRYVAEGTEVLSAQAPCLEEALERAVKEGTPYVILDSKIVDSDRCHEKTVSRKGPGYRLVVFGEEEGFRRERPGPVLPGRPADAGLGCAARECP